MQDSEIVRLYFERNEEALKETAKRYGSFCKAIALRILGNPEDSEECVNDTYFRAWNTIPPKNPSNLGAYLGRIARNLSFDKYRQRNAEKRGGGETALILDELSEITSGVDETFSELEGKELSRAINSFLDTLKPEHRSVFVQRYWHAYSVGEISRKHGISEGNASVILSRARKSMKAYLSERGWGI